MVARRGESAPAIRPVDLGRRVIKELEVDQLARVCVAQRQVHGIGGGAWRGPGAQIDAEIRGRGAAPHPEVHEARQPRVVRGISVNRAEVGRHCPARIDAVAVAIRIRMRVVGAVAIIEAGIGWVGHIAERGPIVPCEVECHGNVTRPVAGSCHQPCSTLSVSKTVMRFGKRVSPLKPGTVWLPKAASEEPAILPMPPAGPMSCVPATPPLPHQQFWSETVAMLYDDTSMAPSSHVPVMVRVPLAVRTATFGVPVPPCTTQPSMTQGPVLRSRK